MKITITKVKPTPKGDGYVGYVSVKETIEVDGINNQVDKLMFIRLADDKLKDKLNEPITLKRENWTIRTSRTDDAEFLWLEPKLV